MTPAEAALVERNNALTLDLLKHAHLISPDPMEQIAALFTAATVLLERQAGARQAGAILWELIAPTIDGWATQADPLQPRSADA